MGYGIGRIPQDADEGYEDTRRAIAGAAGAEARRLAQEARPGPRCMRCGARATMNASLGPSCPDCYDDLAG